MQTSERINWFYEKTIGIANTNITFSFDNPFLDRDSYDPQNKRVHNHLYCEIHLVKCGSISVTSGQNTYTVGENECLLIPPFVYHVTTPTNSDTQFYSYHFSFKKSNSKDTADQYDLYSILDSISQSSVCIKGTDVKRLQILMSEAYNCFQNSVLCFDERLCSLLTLIILEIIEIFNKGKLIEENKQIQINNVTLSVLDYALNTCPESGITLSDVAKQTNYSERHLSRLIKKQYNMSFKQKQAESRIEKAKKLLTESKKPIVEIAEEVGISDISRFYREFKKATGNTPSVYRNSHIVK